MSHTTPSLHQARILRRSAVLLLFVVCCDADMEQSTREYATVARAAVQAARSDIPMPPFSGVVPNLPLEMAPADTLTAETWYGEWGAMAHISSLAPIGDFLVVADQYIDPHFLIFDQRSGELLQRLGTHGADDGQFLGAEWMLVETPSPPRLWVFDRRRSHLSLMEVSSRSRFLNISGITIRSGNAIEAPVPLRDRIVAGGFFPDETLLVLTLDGRVSERVSVELPYGTDQFAMVGQRRKMNRKRTAVSPSRDKIVVAFQYVNRLDFFTPAGVRFGTIQEPKATEPSFTLREDGAIQWLPNHRTAYEGVAATDRFIYALFEGFERGDVNHRLNERPPDPRLVHVFSWDGDFVGEFALDRAIHKLAVTSNDSLLFGAVDVPFPAVGQWDIGTWLQSVEAEGKD